MSDPFTLLGLPRRPWLDEATVRRAFQDRGRRCHPDTPGGDTGEFAALNAAQAALRDPAARLKLLLGDQPLPSAPPDIDFGFRLAAALRLADGISEKMTVATNPISRALLAGEMAAARRQLDAVSGELDRLETAAGERLRIADAKWPATHGLAELASGFVFLARWRAQLRERRLVLSQA